MFKDTLMLSNRWQNNLILTLTNLSFLLNDTTKTLDNINI